MKKSELQPNVERPKKTGVRKTEKRKQNTETIRKSKSEKKDNQTTILELRLDKAKKLIDRKNTEIKTLKIRIENEIVERQIVERRLQDEEAEINILREQIAESSAKKRVGVSRIILAPIKVPTTADVSTFATQESPASKVAKHLILIKIIDKLSYLTKKIKDYFLKAKNKT